MMPEAAATFEPAPVPVSSVPAIEIAGLTKVYGDKHALGGIDLRVAEGSIFGFLGPNGAGKTTTLRILTGLARPSGGSARILGRDVVTATNDVRRLVGYLPDVPGFYDWMRADEFLRFAGSLFGLGGRELDERIELLLDLAGLTGVRTPVGGYSRGMKQRLGVAQALVNAPRLLMLDEPTSALDPIGRKEMLDMIAGLRGRTTVFFSTHILSDVERVCDSVAILDGGRVIVQAPIDELKERYAVRRLRVEVDRGLDRLAEAVRAEPWATSVEIVDAGLEIAITDVVAAQVALPAIVARLGLGLRRYEGAEVSLEDVFLELVKGGAR